jgi:hypothetical protein
MPLLLALALFAAGALAGEIAPIGSLEVPAPPAAEAKLPYIPPLSPYATAVLQDSLAVHLEHLYTLRPEDGLRALDRFAAAVPDWYDRRETARATLSLMLHGPAIAANEESVRYMLVAGPDTLSAALELGASYERLAAQRPELRALLDDLKARVAPMSLGEMEALAAGLDAQLSRQSQPGHWIIFGHDRFLSGLSRRVEKPLARLDQDKNGAWRKAADRGKVAGKVLEAASAIAEAGVDLDAEEIAVVKSPPEPRAGRSILLDEDMVNASDKTGLVRALLTQQLERGVWGPLRHTSEEAAATGLAAAETPEKALRIFKTAWKSKLPKVLERLKTNGLRQTELEPAGPSLPGAGAEVVFAKVDGFLGLAAFRLADGRVVVRGLSADGAAAEAFAEVPNVPKDVTALAWDPVTPALLLGGTSALGKPVVEVRRVDAKGSVAAEPIASYEMSAPVDAIAYSPGLALAAVAQADGKILLASDDKAYALDAGRRVFSMAFDAASRALLLGLEDALGVAKLGVKSVQQINLISMEGAGPVRDISFSPAENEALFRTERGDSKLWRMPFSGSYGIPEQMAKIVPEPGAEADEPLAWDSGSRTLLARTSEGSLRTSRLSAGRQDWHRELPAVAWAVAEGFLDARGKEADAIGEALWYANSASLVRYVWRRLADPALAEKPPKSNLKENKKARRGRAMSLWFLKNRLPDLYKALRDPDRTARLLTALSFLRLVYPYHMANESPLAPLAWARRTMISFRFGNSYVAPVSESFRRHIFYDERYGRLHAAEIKIPGQEKGRETIFKEHHAVTAELHAKFHSDPGVVRSLYFTEFSGQVPMYGRRLTYRGDSTMGLAVFSYEDGKRVLNSGGLLDEKTMEDVAVSAIRLHRLGWSGSNEHQTDMHVENLRRLQDGKVVLVADFGAFEKKMIELPQRRGETLNLLGGEYFLKLAREKRKAIADRVYERLVRDFRLKTGDEKRALMKQVFEELGFQVYQEP